MDGSKRVAMAMVCLAQGVAPAALPILGMAAVGLIAPGAHADVKKVAPRTVVVAKDNTAMRCADGGHFYAVRMLKSGQMLRVDGEGGGWLRVEYPEGTHAYVKQDEATFDGASKSLRLTRGSKLMAANEGGAAPWWYLLETDVPAGTTFANAEPVKAGDGSVIGYLVAAPKAARGFVRAEQVRAATAEEEAKLTGAPAPTPAKPVEPAPKPVETVKADPKTAEPVAKPIETTQANPTPVAPTPTPTPAPKPAETVTAVPAPVAPAPTEVVKSEPKRAETGAPIVIDRSGAGEVTIAKPGSAMPVAPKATGADPLVTTERVTTTTVTTETTTTGTAAAPASTPATLSQGVTRRIDDVNVLRDMFDRAMQKAESESEIRTVVSEFNRTIEAMPTTGDQGKIRNGLEKRRDALTFRMEVLETRAKAGTPDQMDDKVRQFRAVVEQANRQAVYTIVGRMLPSTVYDGKRGMPLMYRVESADISSTRTIGYVVPRDGVNLLPTLGKIVGILGESKMDPALGLNIVAPTRVDELQVVGGKLEVVPTSPGSAAPAPAAPGAASKPAEAKDQPLATPAPVDPGDVNK